MLKENLPRSRGLTLMDTLPFSELGLSEEILKSVQKMGYESPSPIQAKTIPLALTGKDIIGLSQTGSGKTAAFTLPTLRRIDPSIMKPQALIVCPTRELAIQVCEEVFKLSSGVGNIRSMPVYGGAPIDRQLRGLRKGTHIVVGTPGRLLDHLRRKSFDPSLVKTVILDEADRMLDMGFREEMEDMLKVLPKDRQTLFFSATMNPGVRRLITKFGNDPELVEIERKALTVSTIDQSCYEVRGRSKVEALSRIIDIEKPKLTLIFANTKRVVDDLTESLLARGFTADRLHGDITQSMRERVLSKFREGTVEILVATDVAARGLDIDDVELVVNFELPQDPEDYVHRIGRTGRAGRDGKAVNFVFGRDIYRLQTIEKYIRQPIRRERIPSREDVEGRRADQLFETIRERLEASDYKSYQPYLDRLLEQGHTATDISNALITLIRETSGREGQFIAEDNDKNEPFSNERPGRDRGRNDRRDRNDRGDRDDRGGDRDQPRERNRFERKERSSGPSDAKMSTLFLTVGKAQSVKPGDIAGMIYRECELPDGVLGRIRIFPKHTLVDVEATHADSVISSLQNSRLRNRSFRIDHDRGRNED
ncbi:MAG: DEAD/DEAH box helicase [Akkermansiaceae bacterium]